jgi:hypothetical protein
MGNIADRRTSSGEITTLVWTVLLVLGLFVLHVRGGGPIVTIAQVFSALWWHQLRSALIAHHKDPAVAE